ncbi:3-deoxy-D-manno-octulosonic acid transferase [Desulfosarcina alkanivorans]|uniref:3-deoxy-D-manno-octulosonic acid transferase n=1 Tax=Desulfosarcina alkanivorans TaxID=571177 RepID=A0A5K7YSC3_9BACT|nr:glycosyltransferase N-terminal domain-containing protein [Desulfosarcina alkanivorans]BBO67547.1 3-deoxy-D-manno-octulosonic acid transferase [Desulfosarcina alkanivorans]
MNFFHFLYILLGAGLGLIVLPAVWCLGRKDPERRRSLAQRLGYDLQGCRSIPPAPPRIWIHAVSVGEVKAAETIVHALDASPTELFILLTTTTGTGQRYARSLLADRAVVRYAPVDLWGAVGRFLSAYRPDLLVCMETEIWPNWILRAHRKGVKIVFLNGRISERSIRSYTTIRPLIRPVLEKVDAFSMISEADARRIMRLGAPAHRVQINGNVKMDARDYDPDALSIDGLKRIYAVDGHTPVFIAGSVRGSETDILIDIYTRLAVRVPDLVFIIAPRHIERSARIAALARKKEIDCQMRTELGYGPDGRRAPVVILDTIGELRDLYALASVVFCGASLVPLGGQNVLEPAVWAKPVLFGPSMEDFEEARNLLETFGGGICVKDPQDLAERALYLLTHPAEARRLGRLARQAAFSNRGASRRHARVLLDFLPAPHG